MKRTLFTLLAILCSATMLMANGVKIKGIYYLLDESKMTATVTYTGGFCLDNNSYSGNIVIPSTVAYKKKTYQVVSIGKYAFNNCSHLKSVTIEEGITTIQEYAFRMCTELSYVKFPNSLTHIADEGFRCLFTDFKNITKPIYNSHVFIYMPKDYEGDYEIPYGIKEIASCAFMGCMKMSSVTIPTSVIHINKLAFNNCQSLKTINIPEGVTKIGSEAFEFCEGIKNITIPSSVAESYRDILYGCTNLEAISVHHSNKILCDVEGVLFSKDMTNLIVYPPSKPNTEYAIPYGVTKVEEYAFNACMKLSTIKIPNTITFIHPNAFDYCNNLKEVYYPDNFDISKIAFTSFSASPKFIVNVANEDKNRTPQKSVQSAKTPPLLALIDGSLILKDPSENNRIDADEECSIKFKIKNTGKGPAIGCEARVHLFGASNDIQVKKVKLSTINVGQIYEVTIPVKSGINTQDGKVTFSIDVYEPNGWGVAPFDITMATKAYEPPYLQVVDYNVASASGKIRKMEPFTLTFNLQNTKYGDAENVKVKVNLPSNIFVMDGSAEMSYPLIKSGEVKPIQITLAANNNYTTTNIPISIDVKEKHGKFAENKQLDVTLNQATSSSITLAAKDEPKQERKEIQIAMMTSDVDRNIPQSGVKNPNTFVVIIANENYQQVAPVPFAMNDGKIFRQYCEQTLGIPAKNIREQINATGGQIQAQIDWLQTVVGVFENPNVIFYYAGHGIPDEASKTAYLLPVDGMANNLNTCVKLDKLYETLGNMPAGHISVFMDACFSGSKREDGMLASARGVALKAKSGVPQGNMVVFSAAQGNETAYPNREQQHGLFTYYLLKKLQETEGDVALKDLGDYVTKQVSQQSLLLNSKKQTPCVTPSATVGTDWENWKLK